MKWYMKATAYALNVVQSFWRPLLCFSAVGAVGVNTIYLPIINETPVDLVQLSALISSVAGLAAVHVWEKRERGCTTETKLTDANS